MDASIILVTLTFANFIAIWFLFKERRERLRDQAEENLATEEFRAGLADAVKSCNHEIRILTKTVFTLQMEMQNQTIRAQNHKMTYENIGLELENIKHYAYKLGELTKETFMN